MNYEIAQEKKFSDNFFLMSEKAPLMVPKRSELSIIKNFEFQIFERTFSRKFISERR